MVLPSLSPACQMAGGLQSPDIHQCLAVRCSHSSALTWRLVQQTSLLLVNARGLGLMMPPNEMPISWEQWKILPMWHSFPIQMCDCVPLVGVVNAFQAQGKMCGQIQIWLVPVSKYIQGSHKPHYAIILCTPSCLLASVASPIQSVIIMGTRRCKIQQIWKQPYDLDSVFSVTESHVLPQPPLVHEGTSRREKQSFH